MGPNFLVIGAAKAGTSSLCHLLGLHPDVFFTARKELHYFSFEGTRALGREWYESWFAGAGGHVARGEGSTTYSGRTVFPGVAERIAAFEPRMRVLYIVREPFARMESVWLQLRRFGATSPFEDVGQHEVPAKMRVDADFNRAVRAQSDAVVETTNYWQEIQEYRRHFPDEQIHVLLFEELCRDPRGTLRACFEFLGVDAELDPEVDAVHLNSMRDYRHSHGALWRLWSSPGRRRIYAGAARLVPLPVRSWLNRTLLRTPVAERPRWDPETRAWASERLAEDLERFLDFYGFPRAAWELPARRAGVTAD